MIVQFGKIFSPKDRVAFYINLLKRLDHRFEMYTDAYKHLWFCLVLTEKIHRAIKPMRINDLAYFSFNETYGIYLSETYSQTILLHPCGAYGIFQNKEKTKTCEDFKSDTECLLHIPNDRKQYLFS